LPFLSKEFESSLGELSCIRQYLMAKETVNDPEDHSERHDSDKNQSRLTGTGIKRRCVLSQN
jgi:hypothetical protein